MGFWGSVYLDHLEIGRSDAACLSVKLLFASCSPTGPVSVAAYYHMIYCQDFLEFALGSLTVVKGPNDATQRATGAIEHRKTSKTNWNQHKTKPNQTDETQAKKASSGTRHRP